jgi:penicillin-binding protein 2
VTIISLGIGQGEIGETPLQMANATAAIANRGYWYTPHMVKKIVGDDSSLASFREKHVLPIDSSYFKYVLKGLLRVVEAGTGTIAQIPGVTIAGKTGTAQNPHGEDHSVFVALAPVEDPKIVIACIVENGGWGGSYAAPISSLMIEKYLNDTITTSRKALEERMINTNLLP